MDYTLIQSKRKTTAIRICMDGTLEVRAPFHISKQQVEELLQKKQNWILKHQQNYIQMAQKRAEFCLDIGDDLPFLGIYYPIYEGSHMKFSQSGFMVKPNQPIKKQIEAIFRKEAKLYIARKITEFSPLVSAVPTHLTITSASTCFGSCSSKNALSFTWKLMMASEELIDYVVVHELCHIVEHNHSAKFWLKVKEVLPDYKEREKNLKSFAFFLQAQDWNS